MSVVIEYKTKKHYCSCCYQKLPNPVMSDARQFKVTKESAQSWTEWDEAAEYPEDLERLIPEFTHEVISFHAADSNERIIVEDSEVEKVREFILREVVGERNQQEIGRSGKSCMNRWYSIRHKHLKEIV